MPLEYTPGRLMEWLTMEYPVIITSSQIDRCPTMPTAPPTMQCRPIVTLPETPVQAASTECAPMRHVVADLDLIVELHAILDDGVADRAAIDGRVGADFHIRADLHAAQLRDLDPCAAFGGKAKAVAAEHCPGVHQHSRPERSRARRRVTRATSRTSSAIVTPAAMKQCGPMNARAPMTAAAPMTA